jgi:hypothetical protein
MITKPNWQAHYESWRESGLSQKAYCEQAGLKYAQFVSALAYYRKRDRMALPQKLIPVTVDHSVTERIVLRLRDGHQLELPAKVPASWCAELLRCLD